MSSHHKADIRVDIDRILAELKHLDLTESVHYDSRYPVAQGAIGDVFKGDYNQPDGTTVDAAVKRLRTYLDGQLNVTRIFRREIDAWRRLEHPNILPLLGYTLDKPANKSSLLPSLVSEWMENGNILDFVKSNPDYEIERLVLGMAEGLAYLHANNIVHSDIKSGNVLISADHKALISDFGAAHVSHDAQAAGVSSTVTGARGTSRWMAYELLAKPEQYQTATKESDTWSFGMTVLEVLTGNHPYSHIKREGQVISTITKKTLPSPPIDLEYGRQSQIWSVCTNCWSWEPNRRPTMATIVLQLRTIVSQLQQGPGTTRTSTYLVTRPEEKKKSGLLGLFRRLPTLRRHKSSRANQSEDNIPVARHTIDLLRDTVDNPRDTMARTSIDLPLFQSSTSSLSTVIANSYRVLGGTGPSTILENHSPSSTSENLFSGADAAVMAEAFRKALRKPTFVDQQAEGDGSSGVESADVVPRQDLAEEEQDIRSVRVELPNNDDFFDKLGENNV